MLLWGARVAMAQARADSARTWEVRATSGGFIPTGVARNTLKDAQLSAIQVSWLVRPLFALTGTFGWARSRDLRTTDHPKLDVFSYDVGAEARGSEWFTGSPVRGASRAA
ncbi:MAG: hypothetical protein ABI442_07725 [Gemmatimonadaceae bacterium]